MSDRPSAQDGFASYCQTYDSVQRKLMEERPMDKLDLGELERLFARRMATNKMAEFAALNHSLAEAVPALIARVGTLEAALREIGSQAHNLPRSATADRIDELAHAALEGSGK